MNIHKLVIVKYRESKSRIMLASSENEFQPETGRHRLSFRRGPGDLGVVKGVECTPFRELPRVDFRESFLRLTLHALKRGPNERKLSTTLKNNLSRFEFDESFLFFVFYCVSQLPDLT